MEQMLAFYFFYCIAISIGLGYIVGLILTRMERKKPESPGEAAWIAEFVRFNKKV